MKDGDFEGFAKNLGVEPSEAVAQAEKMMSDPEGARLMAELQSNPRVMQAAMDMAMNGEAAAAKYENDAELMALLYKLEKLQGL